MIFSSVETMVGLYDFVGSQCYWGLPVDRFLKELERRVTTAAHPGHWLQWRTELKA
jgi:hypothetical protein